MFLGEIERTLKKVTEGLEIFHETLDKLNTTSTPNQKEKVETDLKKEIKKLQRLRDQIKGWQQLSEIKDKNALNEARKAIETEMERFKILEKEMKIKAFSKEGLNQAAKLDPREKERLELANWLSECVDRLNTGVDAYEAEAESLRLGAKKNKKLEATKQDRLNSLTALTERHRHHIKKLEQIRRLLENERLEIEDIQTIRDDVEYYLDAHQEADFVENEELYDDLDLATSASSDDDDEDHSDADEEEPYKPAVVKKPVVTPVVPVVVPVKPPTVTVVPLAQPASSTNTAQSTYTAHPTTTSAPILTSPPKPKPLSGPSFASAASVAASQQPSVVSSVLPSPVVPATPTISFAAAAKPTVEQQAAAHSRPSSGYEELLAHLTANRTPRTKTDLLNILSLSHQNCPDGYETESSRSFAPRNPVPTPDYYPTAPPAILENPAIFERLDLDTLFFIFYYQQKSYPQYLAARELKRQSWRFHKKYLTWFQRHEEPKSITDEYEQGTYIYFDYESSWCQRKKTEFTFEYRFLEDEESV